MDEPGEYLKDIEHRFVERIEEYGGFGAVRHLRVLQIRKLMRQGPSNSWTWQWTAWTDVPVLTEFPGKRINASFFHKT